MCCTEHVRSRCEVGHICKEISSTDISICTKSCLLGCKYFHENAWLSDITSTLSGLMNTEYHQTPNEGNVNQFVQNHLSLKIKKKKYFKLLFFFCQEINSNSIYMVTSDGTIPAIPIPIPLTVVRLQSRFQLQIQIKFSESESLPVFNLMLTNDLLLKSMMVSLPSHYGSLSIDVSKKKVLK